MVSVGCGGGLIGCRHCTAAQHPFAEPFARGGTGRVRVGYRVRAGVGVGVGAGV